MKTASKITPNKTDKIIDKKIMPNIEKEIILIKTTSLYKISPILYLKREIKSTNYSATAAQL